MISDFVKSVIGVAVVVVVIVAVAIPIVNEMISPVDEKIGVNDGDPVILAHPDSSMTYRSQTKEITIDGVVYHPSQNSEETIFQFDKIVIKIDSDGKMNYYSDITKLEPSYTAGSSLTYSNGAINFVSDNKTVMYSDQLLSIVGAIDAQSDYVMSDKAINITSGDSFYIYCSKNLDGGDLSGFAIYSGVAKVGNVETTIINPPYDTWDDSTISIEFIDHGTYVSPIIPSNCAIVGPAEYLQSPAFEPVPDSLGALIGTIPIIIVAGLIIGVVGTFLYRRLS